MSAEHPTRGPGWGIWLHAVAPVPTLVELARVAEARGASAVLVADEGVDRDVYVTLTAIGAATERLLLVPAVTNPHTRHPVATAAAAAALAEVAPGRVVLGLGAGGSLCLGPLGLRPARPYSALAESVDVIERLLAGKRVTHSGTFEAVDAALSWVPERVPIGIAGRGPRVEQLAGERADWVIVAGKPVAKVRELAATLAGARPPGRDVRLMWNPGAAWRPEHVARLRPHFAYMVGDMPAAWRQQLGIDDERVADVRRVLRDEGAEAAGALLPPAILDVLAIAGGREHVVARLRDAVGEVAPAVVVFETYEYSTGYVDEVADVAHDVGLVPSRGLVTQEVS
jgi:5,10-methylenetetrahydromethanopterin reductase